MARPASFGRFLCATTVILLSLSGRASSAEPLRLVNDDYLGPSMDISDDKSPGFASEIVRHVFAGLGQNVSVEILPTKRAWMMVVRGERDGMLTTLQTSMGKESCIFPGEPLLQDRWVLFVRTADIGKLTFSSFDDLIGHDVAIRRGPVPAGSEQPTVSPELWKLWEFARERNNLVVTDSTIASLRMLEAGRVDYALSSLAYGTREAAKMGLSGKIEPILSRSLTEENVYVCFSKARVSPSLVDAFSRALAQFRKNEAYQALYHKYHP